ncbi:MAG: BrnT family toxin [Bryobacteraceae bacterium]|nr:BrnT family toxin [Bryobacteraceae bacterium]
MPAFLYEFEWDPVKANTNLSKHGLDFERAATVFLDPLAVTIPDEEHSEAELRWITLGMDAGGEYALVIHTFEWLADERGRVRLISARRPTRSEIRNYEAHL